jgi:hypothetical protein
VVAGGDGREHVPFWLYHVRILELVRSAGGSRVDELNSKYGSSYVGS